jgi:hypothetical protein
MKYILITFFILLLPCILTAQLTQDADGESSLLFRANHISLDITKTDVGMGINNIQRSIARTWYPILGGGINAKNESGIGNLFSTGTLVPSSSAHVFFGFSYSNGYSPNAETQITRIGEQIDQVEIDFERAFYREMPWVVRNNTDTSHTLALRESLLKELSDTASLQKIKAILSPKDNDTPQIKTSKEAILKEVNLREELHAKNIKVLYAKQEELSKAQAGTTYFQCMVFGLGGVNAMEFKTFSGFDTLNLKNSFQDQYFRGGFAGLGLNVQYGRVIFGVSYRYSQTNNFSALTKKTYTLQTKVNYGNQTLTEEKQITAYAGTYGKVIVNELKADFAINFKLDDSATNVLLWNPYVRGNLFSRDTSLLQNTIDLGTGFYFFRTEGKFLGGFYIEFPDVQNNMEKAKPVKDQNLRDPLQRLTFGIVTKFSFVSLLNQLEADD